MTIKATCQLPLRVLVWRIASYWCRANH